MSIFYVIIAVLLALGTALVVIFIIRSILRRRGLISRSLNLSLLAVRFPPRPPQDLQLTQLREKIALMEQFYANLSAIRDGVMRTFFYGRPVFALEMSIPSIGEELTFYIAVPRRFAPAVEKLIQGVFPDAYVEESRDYNVFNPEGTTVASRIVLSENSYAPLKTFLKLEGDPLGALTNVFTKLAKEGEGAALQIVARPAANRWYHTIKKHSKTLYEGGKLNEDTLTKTIREVVTIAGGSSEKEEEETLKKRELRKPTPLEEEAARALEGKASKSLFEVNIRLVASAKNSSRAEVILRGLEAAFAQFTNPGVNSFRPRDARGRALDRMVFNFSFRNFDSQFPAVLNTEELTSIFHFPNAPLETPGVKGLKAREAAPPANLPCEGLLLGYNIFRGEKSDIYLTDEDRRRHLYIIGQTGTGKSTFMKNLIIQDLVVGKGVAVIDPHGQMIDEIMEFIPRHRLQDVVYFNPGDVERPMGINMLEYDPMYPEQKTIIVNELFAIFDKLFNMSIAGGPMFEQYFRNATLLVMEDPASGNTLIEIERVLADKAFRDLKLSRSKNIVVNNFWVQIAEKAGGEASLKDMVPYIASKIDNFIANEIMRPIVAQEKSAFNFREVMDSQKILLINLSKGRLGEMNSSFIGLILVGKLLMAALSRADSAEEKRKDFYLYIDEFQNVTTDSIATILSEARKYRLNLTIAHQFIGQLKEEIKKAVFGNVGSISCFRIGSDDAEFMAKQFKPHFTEEDLLQIDNYNCYLKMLMSGETSRPFNIRVYPPEKGSRETVEVAKEISRAKYGRPREEVEEEIRKRFESF